MANICMNRLDVRGSDKAIVQFLLQHGDTIRPQVVMKDYPAGWYQRIGDIDLVVNTPGRLSYEFDSAWHPPMEFIEELALQCEDLEIRHWYWEPGEGFKGYNRWLNGDKTHEVDSNYVAYPVEPAVDEFHTDEGGDENG